MAGTKMALRRYGTSSTPFDYFEIIVDQSYLNLNLGMLVTLPSPYMPGMHMLDVHYNGQYATADGGYEEVDEYHIRFDIRELDRTMKTHFDIGDEIAIKILKQPPILNSVDTELRQLSYIIGEGNFDIDLEYDVAGENVTKETVSGDYNITKEYTYNEIGKTLTETIKYSNRTIVHTFAYDPITFVLLNVRVRTTLS